MSTQIAHENLIKSKTSRSFEEVCGRVEEVCQQFDFSLISELNLAEKIRSKGGAFSGNCRVFEFCNPGAAAKVLEANRDLASLLPCRLAIYEESGQEGTTLSSVAPSKLLEMLGGAEARQEAEEIEENVRAMIKILAS